jgi:hypothetical protein
MFMGKIADTDWAGVAGSLDFSKGTSGIRATVKCAHTPHLTIAPPQATYYEID